MGPTTQASKWKIFVPSTRSPTGSSPLLSTRQRPCRVSNRIILNSRCKSLDKAKGKWVEKLPGVLWAYRTTKSIPISETPFSLAYGTGHHSCWHLHANTLHKENWSGIERHPTLTSPRSVGGEAIGSSDAHCRLLTANQSRPSQESESPRISSWWPSPKASHPKH